MPPAAGKRLRLRCKDSRKSTNGATLTWQVNWDKRVAALARCEGLIAGGAAAFDTLPDLLRRLLRDPLSLQIADRCRIELFESSSCSQAAGPSAVALRMRPFSTWLCRRGRRQLRSGCSGDASACSVLSTKEAFLRRKQHAIHFVSRGRSAVSRQACRLLEVLAAELGSGFSGMALHFVDDLLKVIVITVQVCYIWLTNLKTEPASAHLW